MGRPKHLIEVAGEPMLVRLVRVVQSGLASPVLLGSGDVPKELAALRRIADLPGCAGPCGGIAAALCDDHAAAWLVLACDMPRMHEDAIRWLAATRDPAAAATIPRSSSGFPNPLAAIYEPAARQSLEAIARSGGGPRKLAKRLQVHCPRVPAELESAFVDIDSPGELAALVD